MPTSLSGTGHITIKTAADITLNADVDATTASPGTISMHAAGALSMTGSATVTAAGSAVRLSATGDLTVGNLTATDVSLISGGALINAADSTKNVTATHLRIESTGSVGAADRHVTTHIDVLSAQSSTGGIYITEDSGATVDGVSVTVTEYHAGGTTTAVTDGAQADLTTEADGSIVLVATLGALTLNDGDGNGTAVSADGAGNILLQALAGSIVANADILSGTGHITVGAATDVIVASAVDIATGGGGTICINAETGNVTMTDQSRIAATSGDIRAVANESITLGGIVTTAGVSLIATAGSIMDGGDSFVDVTAEQLLMWAGIGVGTESDFIETTAVTLSSRATSGGIFIQESDGLIIDDTTVTIQQVQADATVTPRTDGPQSDLRTTAGNGSITVVVDGDITLNDGTSPADGTAVAADGSGNVLIETSGDATLNAAVESESGDVDVNADGAVFMNAGMYSEGGILTMYSSSDIFIEGVDTEGGDISIRTYESGSVYLGSLEASGGLVTIHSAAFIEELGDDTGIDVYADGLVWTAVSGIGTLGAIETSAILMSFDTAGGAIRAANDCEEDAILEKASTGGGDLELSQRGGGSLTVEDAATSDGAVSVAVAGRRTHCRTGACGRRRYHACHHGVGKCVCRRCNGIGTDRFHNIRRSH